PEQEFRAGGDDSGCSFAQAGGLIQRGGRATGQPAHAARQRGVVVRKRSRYRAGGVDRQGESMTTTHDLTAIDTACRPRASGRLTNEDLEMIERTRGSRDLLSSKWKVDLLYLLARGVRRYSRLYDNLRGASKKMLTDSLRSLERDGLVSRQVYAEVPV